MVGVAVGDEDGVQPVHIQRVELVHQMVPALEGAGVDHDPLSGGKGDETGVPLAYGNEQQVHLVRLQGALVQRRRVRGHLRLATAEKQQKEY